MINEQAINRRAMNLSLATGVLMLVAKWIAYLMTGSSVIFSDAAESVVHIVAVWFAWYALRVGTKPPDEDHPYGHDKVSFMSAGVEGGLICIAAIVIIVSATEKLVTGVSLQKLDIGMSITAGAALINLALGWYLIGVGKKNKVLIVEANGRHVMTDVWTSAGAVAGLFIAQWSGMLWLDPVIAIVFGANIIYEGGKLMSISIKGLMDSSDPELQQRVQLVLTDFCLDHNCSYHRLRLRSSGNMVHVDYHLILPDDMTMHDAHSLATSCEELVRAAIDHNTEVFTHLESVSQPDGHV
ncbi:MAG: cation transporter [Candidatus Kapabacteria bacterium]|nr:cation transporter [Candidatus Kapabacteria bacterium]